MAAKFFGVWSLDVWPVSRCLASGAGFAGLVYVSEDAVEVAAGELPLERLGDLLVATAERE
jgi:hypothetical protein